MQQLMFEAMEGYAELAIPALHVPARKMPIRFHPQTLCIEAFFDPSDVVVTALAQRHRASALVILHNVVLHDAGQTVQLKADGLQLNRSNALSEWPEDFGYNWSDFPLEENGKRRLELSPQDQRLRFTADQDIPTEHPYQAYYANACPGLRAPSALLHPSLSAPVSFCSNYPQRGTLCAFSAGDFFALEKQIHAALMLIHGRDVPPLLQVRGREICFYRHKIHSSSSYLVLVDDHGSALPDAVMNGFVNLKQERFNMAYLALSYFVAGKQAKVMLEAQYMLLMTCVEAMDGEKARVLSRECTAALLGVSPDAALLFNCMRNKLVHGCGSYQQAFATFLEEDMKERQLDLEPSLQRCVINGVELDFLQLWLRLCERLDAFWCAYLGVPSELVVQRYAPISLMPAVDLQALEDLTKQPRKPRVKAEAKSQEVQDLQRTNAKLTLKLSELKEKLRTQGKAMRGH